ncbi:T9SS type B sorting domain-containing protein [Winogradskyella immobilis]|uniref:Gliding motility-associated C-terminal domain-containing protein n=1 Tax=Winogradskyella immobilis TaxID=2816852 RepID=A0ABS8ENI2_9FLAO|nr:gliding motility-associated C-terminal domain-containing protein [Winogradskyella immobilis]MCC1484562.1 gliding motility-associated C-terminal domain-containing protein [Winogradskyella immobilis]MCG0016654.1 gliding motility-associated C-terminal domain-containing protein [Winogradskyella immobilis]
MLSFTKPYFTFILVIVFASISHAQIVISTPNLQFSKACASPTFNTFNLTFTFSPESNLSETNQFNIELSDASGSFTNSEIIYTTAQGAITSSPATLSFSMPTTVAGENYKIRIKSSSSAANSTGSVDFAAYYKLHDIPFSINNLIETAAYCSNGGYLLTIDSPESNNSSPLQYPSLTYNWYRETSATTSVFVASSETLLVNTPGIYFAETNYGTCTSESFSNRVTVTELTSDTEVSINSSMDNPFCASEGATILTTINAENYQWFKDGEEVTDATEQTYTTDEPGFYSVNIDLGECTTNAEIDLLTNDFESSINVLETNSISEGESLFVTVTTDAIDPIFRWYFNGELIDSAITESYEATEIGNYKVSVTQTDGCISSKEFLFTIIEPFPDVAEIPNIISPDGDGINDTWIIPQAFVDGTDTEVTLYSAQGKVVFTTKNYQNNWPLNQLRFQDINPVYYYVITTSNNRTRKGSITVIK